MILYELVIEAILSAITGASLGTAAPVSETARVAHLGAFLVKLRKLKGFAKVADELIPLFQAGGKFAKQIPELVDAAKDLLKINRVDEVAIIAKHKACFVAGTPVRTPQGATPIEQLQMGDAVISRSEFGPAHETNTQYVEEVFKLNSSVFELTIGGKTIDTTAEHPFFVQDRGWVAASKLQVGDLIAGMDGEWTAVENIGLEMREAEVFNIRVSVNHTYFIGDIDWEFSVWVHNAYEVKKIDGLFHVIDDTTKAIAGKDFATQAQAENFLAFIQRTDVKDAADHVKLRDGYSDLIKSGSSEDIKAFLKVLDTHGVGTASKWLDDFAPRSGLFDEHVVLGLRNQGLANTAERIGAKHFLQGDFRAAVVNAAKNPRTKISVVLDGLEGATPKQKILNAVEDGLENGISNSFTNWEMSILSRYNRLPDVDFILDGKVITNPF